MLSRMMWLPAAGARRALPALLTATALLLAACGGSASTPQAPTATTASAAAATSTTSVASATQAAATTAPTPSPTATSTPTPAPTAAATTASTGSTGNVSSSDLAELGAASRAFLAATSYRETITTTGTATPGTSGHAVIEYIKPDRYHYVVTTANGVSEEFYIIGQTTYFKTGGTWIKTTLPTMPTVGPQAADPKSTLNNVSQATVVRKGTATVDGVQCDVWQITDPDKSQVMAWVGASDHLIRKLVVNGQNGTQTTVTITNYNGGFSINPPI